MTPTTDSDSANRTSIRGRLITFEGIDGAGKSSAIEWFGQHLRDRGLNVVMTREPGGVVFAESLRQLMLHESMQPETESLLAFAARAEHLAQRIEPALRSGQWVLCDRFTDSTFAYQGGGRGVDWAMLERLEQFVHPQRQPDRTYWFDLAPIEAARRRAAVRAADRFEREDIDFFERVRDGYLRRFRGNDCRFCVVDAKKSFSEVKKQLELDAVSLCQQWQVRD